MLWLQSILWSTVGYRDQYFSRCTCTLRTHDFTDLKWQKTHVQLEQILKVMWFLIVVLRNPSWKPEKKKVVISSLWALDFRDGGSPAWRCIFKPIPLPNTSSCPICTYGHSAHITGGFSILPSKTEVISTNYDCYHSWDSLVTSILIISHLIFLYNMSYS